MQLPFGLSTYADRLARVRKRIAEEGLDGLVVTLPDTVHWLTGFDTIGYLWSQALIINTGDEEPKLVTRTTEGPGVFETSWLRSPRLYDIVAEDPNGVIAEEIRNAGLDESRVGIDLQAFTLVPASWMKLQEALPQVTWRDASMLVPAERLVKTPQEIAYQRQAAQAGDYAIVKAMEAIRPGVSEMYIAGVAAAALGEAGSEYAAIPPMVVSGPRSALVHCGASRRSVALGDVVCIELAGTVARYHGIVMRSAVVGKPNSRHLEVWDCLKESLEAAIAAAKPGAPSKAPDEANHAVLARLDLVKNRCHRIGYSTGVAYPPGWLEPMMLVDGDPHILAPNMSFTIEPNLTLPDEGFGYKLGDTVLCTENGGESMSGIGHELFIID
jgi:Xaa-Pro aminopeptidase